MAEVWLAARNDGSFEREVALKLLYRHANNADRNGFAARFTRERDILASLNHPHIARLLDAGVTPDGQPWLALEYVQGQPLTQWCDAMALDLRARVRMFLQVLQAVQHAHTQLVIHRDIKPSNILVTAQGQVQLLDFGIAKLIETEGAISDASALTHQAGRPLTPQYASPEQLHGGALSTASDEYSLGVMLYELLAGNSPYELKLTSAVQLEHAILESEPRAPSRRQLDDGAARQRSVSIKAWRKALANDLDAIVLKSLSKQPELRYGSVATMRMDLQRWLDGEPVLAKAPSAAYLLGKFALRHRWSLSLGVSTVLSLAAVALVAIMLGNQAREESIRANAAREFLIDMFRQADPEQSRSQDITAKQMLEQGRINILTTRTLPPLLQSELLQGIGDAQANMGDYKKADATLGEVAQRYQALGKSAKAGEALVQQASVVYLSGDHLRGEKLLATAWTLLAGEDGHAATLVHYYQLQSSIELTKGDSVRAREASLTSLALAEMAFGKDDAKSIQALATVARIEGSRSQYEAARGHFDEAIARAVRNPAMPPRKTLWMRAELAHVNSAAGQFRLAADQMEAILVQCDSVLDRQGVTCSSLRRALAGMWLDLGFADRATQLLPSFMARIENQESPQDQVEALLTACRILLANHQANEHPEWWARLDAFGSPAGAKVPSRYILSVKLMQAKRFLSETQSQAAHAALKELEARNGLVQQASQRALLQIRLHQALADLQQGHFEPALALLQDKSTGYAPGAGVEHPRALLISVQLARALWATQQREQALALLDHAIPPLREVMGADAPTFVRIQALRQELASTSSTPGTARKLDLLM
jgi:tetratricopeptide (TPR) repeat protein